MGLSVPHITNGIFGQKESEIHRPRKAEIITGILWKLIVSHADVPGK